MPTRSDFALKTSERELYAEKYKLDFLSLVYIVQDCLVCDFFIVS